MSELRHALRRLRRSPDFAATPSLARQRARRLLVAGQVALAITLLVGSALTAQGVRTTLVLTVAAAAAVALGVGGPDRHAARGMSAFVRRGAKRWTRDPGPEGRAPGGAMIRGREKGRGKR